ncbi:MAG: site-2 protease family protein [Deltaproteobacteria bacterium]|nr:site-2 protease family protein [Deltaproteobacteria bacterium]
MTNPSEITLKEDPNQPGVYGFQKPKRSIRIHLILFLLTLATTFAAGALQQGINIFKEPNRIIEGAPFALTLLFILGTHEFGHYLTGRSRGVDVSLPYFIPAPTFLGTFGAFIKMRSPVTNKGDLLDVGAAGPIAGAVIAIPMYIIGLKLSQVIPLSEVPAEGIRLGPSLITQGLEWMTLGPIAKNSDLILHPIAFAAWIGFLVTCLNLLPIGQLDGGHISYAIFGERHRSVSKGMVLILVALGLFTWQGWLMWGLLAMLLGIGHPPPLDPILPLNRRQKITGWVSILLFILTFIPNPFQMIPGGH